MIYNAYIPKHFKPHELMPPGMESNDRYIYYLDGRPLLLMDHLRIRFGSIIVNNYVTGGNIKYAGFRPNDCPVGNPTSQHRFGRAFDLKFKRDVDLKDVANHIVSTPVFFQLVNCIRIYNWGIHIDSRNTLQGIVVWDEATNNTKVVRL